MPSITYEDIVQSWKNRIIQNEADLDVALSNYRILFAYHSNRIENAGLSLHETREIFENGKAINYTGDPRAIFETQNQKICYEYLKQKIVAKEPVTPELICDVHVLLNQGCYDESRWLKGERPGIYKKHYYGVGEDAGVLPEDVPDEIQFICDELSDINKDVESILTAAAYFHCNFENIHPFADGNGRMARLWHTAILSKWKSIFEFIPIESQIEKFQDDYYDAIAKCHVEGSSTRFIEFMLLQIDKILEEIAEQVNLDSEYITEYVKRMLEVMEYDVPYTSNVIMEKLGLRSKETFRKNYMNPALEMNLVRMTIPDKPNSRNQRYIKGSN